LFLIYKKKRKSSEKYRKANNALAEIGKPRVSFEHFLGSMNPRDWDETFRNFGVNPEKEGQEFSRRYNHYKKRNIGKLIPPEKIFPSLQRKGVLYLLSAASKEKVDAFIEGYGLLTYFLRFIIECTGKQMRWWG